MTITITENKKDQDKNKKAKKNTLNKLRNKAIYIQDCAMRQGHVIASIIVFHGGEITKGKADWFLERLKGIMPFAIADQVRRPT